MRYASLDYVRWLRLSFLFVLSVRQARAWGASQTNPKGTKRVAAFFQVLGFKLACTVQGLGFRAGGLEFRVSGYRVRD